MPTSDWAGGGGTSHSASGTITSTVPVPSGRADCNGNTSVLVTSLRGYVSSRSSVHNVNLYLNGMVTSVVARPISTAGQDTGYLSVSNPGLINGGALTFAIQSSGDVFFGKSGGGTVTDGSTTWTNPGYLGGGLGYVQAPSAPGAPAVTPSADGTSATVTISAPVDNGGSGITNYSLQRATDAAFTTGVATINSTGSTLVTSLTPGQRYFWRATAQNVVQAYTGALGGTWSTTTDVTQPSSGLGAIRSADNTAWVDMAGSIRSADNTAWTDLDGMMRSADNTAWVPLGSP